VQIYGYRILEKKSSTQHGEVYFAVRERDSLPVVLKSSPRPRNGRASRARREFHLLEQIESERVAKPVGLECQDEFDVLVVRRCEGVDLSQFASKCPVSPRDFLEIASQCAEALGDIHHARIIHKDIKPANLLVNPETLELHVIDFGISAELGEAQRRGVNAAVEGTLAYMSPEQTGRIDTGLDFRSDLYSLGATLYELLTGRPPFDDGTPEEMVYAHIAQRPPPAVELAPEIPVTLSRIVMRLLEKDPEERYQTALGLRADLVECIKQWVRTGGIDPRFVLGSHDAPNRLRFPRRLYGRADSLDELEAALGRARSGSRTFVLLLGPAGIGKTALADSLRNSIVPNGGLFAKAKFDRCRRDRPYAGFIDAFESVFEQILAESGSGLEGWRTILEQTLCEHIADLTQLLPGLSMIVQEESKPTRLPANERQARIGAGIKRLVRALSSPDRPLVLVLDDLQWADSGSRFLFEELLGDRGTAHVLIVATLRDSTHDRTDRWIASLAGQVPQAEALREIRLGPLSDSDVEDWLSEVLGRSQSEVAWLTRRVALRTGRSPQLIHEFLIQLQDCGALYASSEGWTWDELKADAAAMSDQAVSFAAASIEALPESARDLLQAASCIGDVFDPEFLLEVVGSDRVSGFRDLMTLSTACFIAPCRDGFRFVHDRLREAAGQQLEPTQKQALHRCIAMTMLGGASRQDLGPQAMRIADHLNRASEPASAEERIQRIEINLLAGKRALESQSGTGAEEYIRAALDFFGEEHWQSHPELGFQLYFRLVESAALSGHPEQAERYLSFLETRPLSLVQWARVAARRVDLRTSTQGPASAIEAALRALEKLGIRFPSTKSLLRIRLDVLRTRFALRNVKTSTPSRKKEADPNWRAAQLLLSAIGPPTFREELRLHLLTIGLFLRGQIERRAPIPPLSLISFAHSQAVVTGDYECAARLGELALERARELEEPRVELQVRHLLNVLVDPWRKPRREIQQQIQDVTHGCFEFGIRELGLYSKLWHAILLLTVGEPLSLVEREIGEHLSLAKRISPTSWALRLGILNALAPLTGSPGVSSAGSSPSSPHDRTSGSELASEAAVLLSSSRHYSNIVGTIQVMVLYLLGQPDEAFYRGRQLAGHMLWAGGTTPHVSEFELFLGLSAAALAGSSRGRIRSQAMRELRQISQTMAKRSRSAPCNFAHLVCLLQAETHLLRRRPERAEQAYRDAARLAEEHRYPNHSAVIDERLASLMFSTGKRAEAVELRSSAISRYEAWGAHVKVDQLRRLGHRAT